MYSLAVKPTHRAYGTTFRSQCEETKRIIVVVLQIQPTNMQTKANSHSGCKSGVKHICGRLYKVIQVHINPRRVSPGEETGVNIMCHS
jgi:hypothetical protein